MRIWLILIAAGLLTYLTRLSFIWLFERWSVPILLQRALRFVPPSVLSVIIFQGLFIQDNNLALGVGNTRLLAGVIAILVAWRTRSALLTIAVGMIALVALNAILPR